MPLPVDRKWSPAIIGRALANSARFLNQKSLFTITIRPGSGALMSRAASQPYLLRADISAAIIRLSDCVRTRPAIGKIRSSSMRMCSL